MTRRHFESSVSEPQDSNMKQEQMSHIIEEQHRKLRDDLQKDQQAAILELKAELSVIKEGFEDSNDKISKLESEVTNIKTSEESTDDQNVQKCNFQCLKIFISSFAHIFISKSTLKTGNGIMIIILTLAIILAMPGLHVESCPKQVNKFDIEQQIHQVEFGGKKDPQDIARHSIYKNWMGLKKIHEDTQIYILICFVGSFLTVALGLCIVKLGKRGLRTFME